MLKINYLVFIFLLFIFLLYPVNSFASNVPLEVYYVEPSLVDSFDVINKGTKLNLVLLNNVSSKENFAGNEINFKVYGENDLNLRALGIVSSSRPAGRFLMSSNINFSVNKLFLDNGQEIKFSAFSPSLEGVHPPHASSNSLGIARTITNLSLLSSPVTLGASLGIGFLVNGALSAYKNGPQDFLWGGFDGIGLSLLENIFRKQPDVYLEEGTVVPFTLQDDLKINKGITKEEIKQDKDAINCASTISQDEIQKLINRGDLAGAIELSAKSGNIEIYEQIVSKITN